MWIHPHRTSNKVITGGTTCPLWYSTKNGSFCAKVPPQESDAASLALFNRVNTTSVTAMNQKE